MTVAVFTIPLWADLLAVAIGSVQGAAYAAQFRDRRLDLLGVAIVGIATGFGGGLIRDILLNQIPRALESNWYLPVATAAAFLGMLLERVVRRLGTAIAILDALTIGLFCAIGTTMALDAGLPAIPAVFVGSIAAVGGSILRDLLLNQPIALMHVGSLYAVAALVGAGLLVTLVEFGVPMLVAAIVCVVVTFTIRTLSVLFNWTLPEAAPITRVKLFGRRRPTT